MYCIYCITGKINGKTYIGQHKTDNLDDDYMGSGILINKAFKKYGIENFSKSILAVTETKENVDILEKFFIALYRSEGKAEYNISNGGDGGDTLYYASDERKFEHKKMMKIIMNRPEIKKKISQKSKEAFSRPETYNKLKESHKIVMNRPEVVKRARESHLGKKLSPETIKKLSEVNIGKNNWSKGRTYYTNGKMNICAFECPEGFHKGRTWKKDMM